MGDLVRLTPEDIEGLNEATPRPSVIKKLRDHHHLVARLVAEGKRTTDIALETGLSISRVSILKGDPTFQQLVEMYRLNQRQLEEAAFYDTAKKRALAASQGWDEINDRLADTPENISNRELVEFIEAAEGKISKSLSITANLQPLAEMHERRRKHIDALAAENAKELNPPKE